MQEASYTDPHVAAAQAFALQDFGGNGYGDYYATGQMSAGSKEVLPGRRVILAHITGLKRPTELPLGGLTLETLHAICLRFGVVDKIVCVTNPKSGTPVQFIDTMIQFESDVSAGAALQALDGTSLSDDGYNYAQVKYSKHEELTTDQNTDRIRDFRAERLGIAPGTYTNTNTNTGGGYVVPPPTHLARTHPAGSPPDMNEMSSDDQATKAMLALFSGGGNNNQNYSSNRNQRRVILAHITSLAHPEIAPLGGLTIEALHAAFSHFGFVEKIVCSTMPKSGTPVEYVDAMVQFESPVSATATIASFDKNSLTGDGYNYAQLKYSKHTDLHAQINNERSRDFTQGASGGGGGTMGGSGGPNINEILKQAGQLLGGEGLSSAVVIVQNLDEHQAEPDCIFNLFSLYGYVVCVKILPHARNTALVQYTEADFADLAVRYLNGSTLFGRQLQIIRSEETTVSSSELDPTTIDSFFKSYRGAVQFWPPGSQAKISANACGPSRTIFLKNIPPQVSSELVIQLCSMYGTVVDFAFLPRKGDRFITAVVQMSSLEEGLTLVALGQNQYLQSPGGESMRLMAGFSKRDQMPSSVSTQQQSTEHNFLGSGALADSQSIGGSALAPLKRPGDPSIYNDHIAKQMCLPDGTNFENSFALQSDGANAFFQHDLAGGGKNAENNQNKRVVLAHITGLSRPNELPLGGINIDILHAVFGQCGIIEKIVCSTLPKTGTPIQYIDAMVQFDSPLSAEKALRALDGASLTADGFFHAQMKYSKHDHLNAMANNDRMRDFTTEAGHMMTQQSPNFPMLNVDTTSIPDPELQKLADNNPVVAAALALLQQSGQTGEGVMPDQLLATLAAAGNTGPGAGQIVTTSPGFDAGSAAGRRVILAHITSLRLPDLEPLGGLTVEAIHAAFSHFGPVEKIVCATMPKSGTPIQYVDAMVQFADNAPAAACIAALDKRFLTNDGYHHVQLKYSKHAELHAQGNSERSRDFTTGAGGNNANNMMGAMGNNMMGTTPAFGDLSTLGEVLSLAGGNNANMGLPQQLMPMNTPVPEDTPVAIVFNLNEEKVDVDCLFHFFSLYGYVEVVKIVYNRRHTAMVQFSKPSYVDLAAQHLSGTMLFGKMIQVNRSKQPSIRCSERDNSSQERTTRSFLGTSQFWMQDTAEEVVASNACPPSTSLYVKNVPTPVTEQEVVAICSQYGAVTSFNYLPRGEGDRHKMGMMTVATIDDAISIVCLGQKHAFKTRWGDDERLMIGFAREATPLS